MSVGYRRFLETVSKVLSAGTIPTEDVYDALVDGLPEEEQELCEAPEEVNVERFVVFMKIVMRYNDALNGNTDLSHEDMLYITQKSSLTELPINYNTLVEAWANNVYTISDALSVMLGDNASDEFSADIAAAIQELNKDESVKLVMT